jgi:glycerate 2-kinase
VAELKQLARRIFAETLAAIDLTTVVEQKLARSGTRIRCGDARVDLREYARIRMVAMGKAAQGTAEGLRRVLAPEFHAEGIIVVPTVARDSLPGVKYFVAGHPLPTAESFAAARAILELLESCDERTLVFFLLSGGGSALVEWPLEPRTTLAEMRALYQALVTCGAPIEEINAVRKHVSAVKGGRLAAAARRAMKLTFGVMDVPEGKESALASGPTLPDPTTLADVQGTIERYGLLDKLPVAIRKSLEAGRAAETPKPGDGAFARAAFSVLLGKSDLFHRAHCAAEAEGFITQCDNATDDWPIGKAVDFLLGEIAEMRRRNPGRRVALIANGEVSSPVTGNGVGGRNAAFVLDCVGKIAGQTMAVLSAGTDGIDGNSPAAGAVADGETVAHARAATLDPADFFRRSDAYSFFARLGDAVVTGPTGNNLRDLRVFLAE